MQCNPRLPLLVFSATLLTCLAAVPALGQEMKLVGTWVVESAQRGGEDYKQPVGDNVTFTESAMQVKSEDGDPKGKADVKLDAKAAPKQIECTVSEGGKTLVLKGIYAVEGETLRLCFAKPGDDRPTSFETKEGSERISLVLKRTKQE